MSQFKTFERAKSLLNDFFSIIALRCPYHIGGRACVVCDEMESCDAIEVKRVDDKDLRLVVAGNSAMLSLKIYFKSDIEQFVMAKLFIALQEMQDLPIIKPEEGFSMTFYTKHGQAIPQEQQFAAITKVLDLLLENPWIETKMLINNWIKRNLEKLEIQIKREIPKVVLKTAPQVERSKIFESKHKPLTGVVVSADQEKQVQVPSTPESQDLVQPPVQETFELTPQETIPPPVQEAVEPEAQETPEQEELIQKPKVPKQSFFITAKEREDEFASWPPYIKRKEAGEKEEVSIPIPSVTKATKKIGPVKKISPKKKPVAKSPILQEEKFELRIHEKKQAKDKILPPMPKDDPHKILSHLERIVRKDYEMSQLSIRFEEARDKIKETMFHSRFLFEMGQVAFTLRKGEPGMGLTELTRKEILKKISTWKGTVDRK
ncbi:MAG: hypothetical protein HWN66_10200 [Candidatus Helarchaeota archaeon]|nr:hypothetical protein [Candidatus Helarchaeota archaeon]